MEDSFNKKIVKKQIKEYMNSERYIHTIQVSKIAVELAIANNISVQKAWLAAMYHDIAKQFDEKSSKKWINKEDIKRFPNLKTMHGLIGSRFVREKFNCTDKMVLKAIADHVMPPIHSSKLTMIIYCADKLVLGKEHKNIYGVAYNTLIERAKYNLKKVFLLIREKNKETQKDWIKYY